LIGLFGDNKRSRTAFTVWPDPPCRLALQIFLQAAGHGLQINALSFGCVKALDTFKKLDAANGAIGKGRIGLDQKD